uniref:Uncharacterized protein n=1 Tax=Eptatretus burgeri TaxID=7764 RepID=A0A8C4X104_EPTBU
MLQIGQTDKPLCRRLNLMVKGPPLTLNGAIVLHCCDFRALPCVSFLQILEYEVGFLICAIIGLLFMVIMPLVGFCFCLCRCCNNCGGKMRQKADSNTPYRRCTFLSLLLFFTILVHVKIDSIPSHSLCAVMSNSHDKLVKIDTLQQNLQSNLVKLNESLKNETRELNNMFATCPAPKCDVLKNDLDKLVPAADFNKVQIDNYTARVVDCFGISEIFFNISFLLKMSNQSHSTCARFIYMIVLVFGFTIIVHNRIIWIVALVICCIIFFIVLLIILGILFGLCGTSNKATPTSRGCVSHSGGNFLMAAVGFSFLLSWIIMIVVVVLFITGGNIHKLACKPISDRTFYEVSAQHHPFPFDSIHSRGTKHLDLLDTNLSLDTLQNIHDVSFFQFMIYKVGKFTIKSQSFSFLAVTLHLDVDRQISIVYGVASWYDLTPTTDASARASSLRKIHTDQVIPMNESMVSAVKLVNAERIILKFLSCCYENCFIGLSFSQKQLKTLIQEIETLSKRIQNVYWFGLGWSLFFLIPTIIFAVKLAKFFRRMDAEETYEK